MRKSSKVIKLLLVGAAFGTSIMGQAQNVGEYSPTNKRLHLRGDTSDKYTKVRPHHGGGLFYYRFYPMGSYYNGMYHHTGYSSSSVSSSSYAHPSNAYSNRGTSTRGGFGRSSGFRVGG